jgi:uncharacterized protein
VRRDDALAIFGAHRDEIAAFGVSALSLFGSVARDEAGPDSNVDLLVEFDRSVGLFTLVRLQTFLTDLLGRPVDLVMPDAVKRQLRDQILKEAVRAA